MDKRKSAVSEYDEVNDIINEDFSEDDYRNNIDKKNSRTEKSIKRLFGIIIAALSILVVLLIIIFAVKNSKEKKLPENNSTTNNTTTEAHIDDNRYTTGVYTVSASGNLRLRKDHSMNAEHIMSIPSGTNLTITEIYFDKDAASEEEKYWGRTLYKEYDAWVCLCFMKKVSDELPSIDNENTTSENKTETDDTTTENRQEAETTTAFSVQENTTAVNTSVAETAAPVISDVYSTGKYYFENPDSQLHLRSSHSVSSENIADIPSGEYLTVSEIYEDNNADTEALKYWGHVKYLSYDGWVCMSVLQKAQ